MVTLGICSCNCSTPVPVKILWNSWVPTKICFFAWEAWWGKVLTMEQLKKRGFPLASSPLCLAAKEDLNHLLIHCPPVWSLWSSIIYIKKSAWVWPGTTKTLLWNWTGFQMSKKTRKLWLATPLCLFWVVWRERNQVVFDVHSPRLKSTFISSLLFWARFYDVGETFVNDLMSFSFS